MTAAAGASDSAAIVAFRGQYRWLSNFHRAEIVVGSHTYPTNEHAFQAHKTLDRAERARIRRLSDPGDARAAGRSLPLRADWEDVKQAVMLLCVRAKFTQHADLAGRLLATGDAHLEEANTHGDRVWGTVDGHGSNLLGVLLMQVRGELRQVAPRRGDAARSTFDGDRPPAR